MAANACRQLPATVVASFRAQEGVPNSKPMQGQPRLYLNNPSWIVTTHIGKTKTRSKPKGRCVVCHGRGRVDCFNCSEKGRTNCVDMEMLPRGEWPKWSCGGSGLCDFSRCLGTREYIYIMGFRFLNQHDDVDPQL